MRTTRSAAAVTLVVAVLFAGVPAAAAAPTTRSATVVFSDDFRAGFDYGTPTARWLVPPRDDLPTGDGVPVTGANGLTVTATGTNPRTGEPAFVYTVAQEDDNGTGAPGTSDHGKFAALVNHVSASGAFGFDAAPGTELTCRTRLSARTYGTAGHPFGSHVLVHSADLRLASAAFIAVDQETGTVFDFFLTNNAIWAYYERLPRPGAGAFSYAIPVAVRTPSQEHELAIAYDRSAGVARWLVDGREALRLDRIGHRAFDRRLMFVDNGGPDEDVEPRQLACGIGLFTLLDGAGYDGTGLVRLSSTPNFYYSARLGEPRPQRFADEESRDASRLWGQGAQVRVREFAVTSGPAR